MAAWSTWAFRTERCSALLAAAAVLTAAASAAATPVAVSLVSMPGRTATSLARGTGGELYLGCPGTREVLRYRDGKLETLASLPIQPRALLMAGEQLLVSGFVSSASGVAVAVRIGNGRVVAVGLDGVVGKQVKVGTLPDGIVHLKDDVYLVADGAEGKIWRVDMNLGDATVWLQDTRLGRVRAGAGFGAAGLTLRDGVLHVAHTNGNAILKIGVGPDFRPQGELSEMATMQSPADIDFASDGRLYVATGAAIYRVAADGSAAVFTDAAQVDGGTALIVDQSADALYTVTTGRVLPAIPATATQPPVPARRAPPELLRIPLNGQGE